MEDKTLLVLEYTRLCLVLVGKGVEPNRKNDIKTRLNEIRRQLGMELI